MTMCELKEWNVQTFIKRVADMLISDGVSFSFDADEGIIFSAPDDYAEYLNKQLGQVVTEYEVETN